MGGRIVATGTFAELKGRFASLMSQRTEAELEEERAAVAEEEEARAEAEAEAAIAAAKPEERPRSVQESKFDFAGALPDRDHEGRKAVESSSKRKLRHHPSSRSQAATAEEEAQEAKQKKAKEIMQNAPKDQSVLIEKEDRAQGAVGWDVWIQYFSSGEKSWSGFALLVRATKQAAEERQTSIARPSR
jgi:hypothetical protein